MPDDPPATPQWEIFVACAPGLEPTLTAELARIGVGTARATTGGATVDGGWPALHTVHLWSRVATRALIRFGAAKTTHLAQLDRWARTLPWADLLPRRAALDVSATCAKSKIYHSGAAAERVARAAEAALGAPDGDATPIGVQVRLVRDVATLSIDATGAPLHQRGFRQAVGKAPMRETLAAALLLEAGYDGSEPALDPLCGSGVLAIEAAEIAAGLAPGRGRGFAFERFVGFDAAAWDAARVDAAPGETLERVVGFGSDRDAGAVDAARANAERAGVSALCRFEIAPVSAAAAPDERVGLLLANPPYGARIGDRRALTALYAAFGETARRRFTGWRVAIVTSEPALARATGLPFERSSGRIAHGGLSVRFYATGPLGPARDAGATRARLSRSGARRR